MASMYWSVAEYGHFTSMIRSSSTIPSGEEASIGQLGWMNKPHRCTTLPICRLYSAMAFGSLATPYLMAVPFARFGRCSIRRANSLSSVRSVLLQMRPNIDEVRRVPIALYQVCISVPCHQSAINKNLQAPQYFRMELSGSPWEGCPLGNGCHQGTAYHPALRHAQDVSEVSQSPLSDRTQQEWWSLSHVLSIFRAVRPTFNIQC